MNPYEILEVEPGASRPEIDNAYALACLAYSDDSPASYSLYSAAERAEMRDRVERAYRMLTDPVPEKDAGFFRQEDEPPPQITASAGPAASGKNGDEPIRPMQRRYRPIPRSVVESTDIPGPYDGPTLKKIRESRGVELEEIACLTKISLANLRFLESNAYAHLPAKVYLRGFLAEYARCLRLDAQAVVRSYLEVAQAGG